MVGLAALNCDDIVPGFFDDVWKIASEFVARSDKIVGRVPTPCDNVA